MKAIANYIKAGTSGICVVTHEETRVEADVWGIAKKMGYTFFTWSCTRGVQKVLEAGTRDGIPETEDPVVMLERFGTLPEKSVLLCQDFHAWVKQGNPVLVRKLRDAVALGKSSNRVIVLLGCMPSLPPEVEKEMVLVNYELPTRAEHLAILLGVSKAADIKINKADVEPLIDAASGMAMAEAENAFALSFAECGEIRAEIVQREKSQAVKKSGLLEIVETKVSLNDIGGLAHLKQDLHEKRNLFTKEARDYGLPTPQGLLVVGQPGTGKSLTASATATIFGLPLIRLEAGRLFGSLVGESEGNWRTAFATVKAIAPCILWIDEVDGLFASSGSHDGGTTQRVIKAILQDMQFNGDGIFFMFTANDIDRLPDPLIDRLSVWSVDLPTAKERADIWRIQIAKRNRRPEAFKLTELAEATEGFSGRQIEMTWLKAMTLAFNDGGRQPSMSDAIQAASRITPTSTTMAEQITARRARLASRAQPASETEAQQTQTVGLNGARKFSNN